MQKLRENNRRLERELHGFLQKKYEFMQSRSASAGGVGTAGGGGGGQGASGGGATTLGAPQTKGALPQANMREGEINGGARGMVRSATTGSSVVRGGEKGANSVGGNDVVSLNLNDLDPEAVREKRVIQTMCDFFGF
jgi:hypothetical protein